MRLVTLLVALLAPAITAAQPLEWSYTGSPSAGRPALNPLPDGSVVAVHIPGTFPTGLYFSPDGGVTWRPAAGPHSGPGAPNDVVRTPGGVLIGPGTGFLHVSHDGGRSWEIVEGHDVVSNDPFVALPDRVLRVRNTITFVSTDDGGSWTRGGFLPIDCCSDLAYTPDGTVWAGGEGGTAMSTDGGVSWLAANPGLPADDRNVRALAVGGGRLFALTQQALYVRSVPGDTGWHPVRTFSGYVADVAVTADGTALYVSGEAGRVFVSFNGGGTWTTQQVGHQTMLSVATTARGTVLAAEDGNGVWVNTPGGAADAWAQRGVPACIVAATATVPVIGDRRLYATCEHNGVAVSDDDGRTWTGLGNPMYPVSFTQVLGLTTTGSLYMSLWESGRTLHFLPDTKTWEEAFPEYAVGFGSASDGGFYAFFSSTLARTSDDGETWASRPLPFETLLGTVLRDGRLVVIASGGRPAYSDDGGATWAWAPETVSASSRGVLVASERGALFVTDGSSYAYRSTDRGAHWSRIVIPGHSSYSVGALDAGPDGDVVLASQNVVYLSRDDGATWLSLGEVVPRGNWPFFDVSALHVTPDRRILAGVEMQGFFSAAYAPTTGTETPPSPVPPTTSAWRAWPNPAAGALHACCAEGAENAALYDLLGRRVATAPIQGGAVELDVSRVPPGSYLLKADDRVVRVTIQSGTH